MRRVHAAHLRRQHRSKAFAHEHDVLASLTQRSESRGESLQRAHHDVVANALDLIGRISRVVLLDDVPWGVVEFAAVEGVDCVDDLFVIARQQQIRYRHQRIHDADHVGGTQLLLDEPGERRPHRHRVRLPHMIVVHEEHKDTHIISRGFELFVIAVANLLRRRTTGNRVAVDLDQLELLDLDRLAVLEHLEVVLGEIGDWLRLLVGDDHVNADEVDAPTERRWLSTLLRVFTVLLLTGLTLTRLTLAGLPLS